MSLKVTNSQLPEGWKERKLEDIATFRNGLNFTQNSKGELIKIVGVKDFQNHFWVQEDQLEFVTIDGELKEIDVLRQGDILTVRSNGNKDLIGRCVLIGNLSQKTSHSGFTIRIRLEREDVYPSFLIHLLKSRDLREQLTNSGGGINISSLNQQSLSQLKIRFPSLPEQKRIVEILDEVFEGIDRAIANTEKNLANARELFESYLNAFFTRSNDQWEWVSLSKITTDITDGDHQPPPKSQDGIPFITISNIDKQKRKIDFSNTFKVPPAYFEKLKDNRKPRKAIVRTVF